MLFKEESRFAQRVQVAILLMSLALVASAVGRLVPRWLSWRSGSVDAYPGVLSATSSLLLALVIPVPLFMQRAKNNSRRHLVALWLLWLLLMGGFLLTVTLEMQSRG